MNLLITGAWQFREETLLKIYEHGHEVCIMPMESSALPCPGEWVEGVICNCLFLHHSLDEFPNLRFIQLTSAGFDRIPMDEIQNRGIGLCNARGVYSIPMAEFALAGVLHLYKQMPFFQRNKASHIWEKHRGIMELHDKCVCIIGCGSVGQSCALAFSALGCQIIGVDIVSFSVDSFSHIYSLDQLDNVLPDADIVLLCLPYTQETDHLFDMERFTYMKDGSVFVNISRGKIVDTDALINALQCKLMGAVLDVFEEEPLDKEPPLWDMENVVLTPHNSFVGDGNSHRLDSLIISNLGIL